MPVTGVTAVGNAYEANTSLMTDQANESMGKDDFLHLLITELTNQNPLEPMDNKDFISQMAQFSSLEQMTNMNTNLELLQKTQESATTASAISMLGKLVDGAASIQSQTDDGEFVDDYEFFTGIVEGIGFEDGVPLLMVDGREVTIDQVTNIYEAD